MEDARAGVAGAERCAWDFPHVYIAASVLGQRLPRVVVESETAVAQDGGVDGGCTSAARGA
jgi:hypothetical protein